MVLIENLELEYEETEKFLKKVKKGMISAEEKNTLYLLVMQLKNRTETQKERFLLYFNLKPNESNNYKFTELGKIQGCSSNAIRYSIIRIRSALANLKHEKREIFVRLVKDCNKRRENDVF